MFVSKVVFWKKEKSKNVWKASQGFVREMGRGKHEKGWKGLKKKNGIFGEREKGKSKREK